MAKPKTEKTDETLAPAPEMTRETVFTLDPTVYALGAADRMSGSWTDPRQTPGPLAIDAYGDHDDLALVKQNVPRRDDDKIWLADGGVRFVVQTFSELQAVSAALITLCERRQVIRKDYRALNSTVAKVEDAVRGPADTAQVATVPSPAFPLFALRLAKPTPVVLETSADGKRRLVIELD